MQAVTYINGKSDLPVYVQHAAEYYTTGNRRLTKRLISYLVICHWYDTRSGKGCRRNQKVGATLLGFIDTKGSVLAEQCDHVITYPAPGTEQIKFFMVADRLIEKS